MRMRKFLFLAEKAANSTSGAMLNKRAFNTAQDRVNRAIPDFSAPKTRPQATLATCGRACTQTPFNVYTLNVLFSGFPGTSVIS